MKCYFISGFLFEFLKHVFDIKDGIKLECIVLKTADVSIAEKCTKPQNNYFVREKN